MSKIPILIAGIALLVICAGIWVLQAMKRQPKPIAAASAASTQGQRNPPCKVYSISPGKNVQKWWVWNGITPRSESHFEDATTVQDTTEEAVRVEVDGDIDPSRLLFPRT